MDEPTSGLDPHTRNELIVVLKKIVQERPVGILIASHDMPFVQAIYDILYVLGDASIHERYERSKDEAAVVEYLNSL